MRVAAKWFKQYKDGRVEEAFPTVEEINYENGFLSVTLAKTERKIGEIRHSLGKSIRLPNIGDSDADYKALDVKMCYDSNNYPCLYLVYATTLISSGGAITDIAPPYTLYYAKYRLDTERFVYRNVAISNATYGVAGDRRATINRYDNGVLWVCYMDDLGERVLSCTSSDDGQTWGTRKTLAKDAHPSRHVYQENDTRAFKKYVGSWHRTAYPRASDGFMTRSTQPSTSYKSYVSLKFTGTDARLLSWTATSPKGKVGIIKIYIDGKFHKQVDLSSYNAGYMSRIYLNKYKLAPREHTCTIYHWSGDYFYVDGVEVLGLNGSNEGWSELGDTIIRKVTGLTPTSGAPQEAITFLDRPNPKNAALKQSVILVDRTGVSSGWGDTGKWTEYIWNEQYVSSINFKGTFHENLRGLWLFTQFSHNGRYYIRHYLYQGQTSLTADYSAANWMYYIARPGTRKPQIHYTAGSCLNGSATFFCTTAPTSETSNRVHSHRRQQSSMAVGVDPEFYGIEFRLPGETMYAYQAFNFEGGYKDSSTGLIGIDGEGYVCMYELSNSSTQASIENLSKYVHTVDISHSEGSEPSSLRLSLVNIDNLLNSRNEVSEFYGLLPKDYDDQSTRFAVVDAFFDQGPFYYRTRIFTGIVGEVSEDYNVSDYTISISAYDYSRALAKFNSPYYYVYANPPTLWAEAAEDYPLQYDANGNSVPSSVRGKEVRKIGVGSSDATKDVTVGWDLGASTNTSVFTVDTDQGYILQNGFGKLLSPNVGIGNQAIMVDFTRTSASDPGIEIGFQLNGWVNGYCTSGCLLRINFAEKKCDLRMYNSSSNKSNIAEKGNCNFRLNRRYRAVILTSRQFIWATVLDVKSGVVVAYLKGTHLLPYKSARRLCIGCAHSATLTNFQWHQVLMFDYSSKIDLKTDKKTAEDLVCKAFQGIIPFVSSSTDVGDYYSTLVVQPESDFKATLDRLSYQNNKSWYFDYDGSFVFDRINYDEVDYRLSDRHFERITLSFNPSESRNWVEAVDGKTVPKVRLSLADTTSLVRSGIRFKQVSSDEITNKEQAKKLAIQEMYSANESMEKLSLVMASPMLSFKPRDTVRINSGIIKPRVGVESYIGDYVVNSVDISGNNTGITLTLELSSKKRSAMANTAKLYSEGGVNQG